MSQLESGSENSWNLCCVCRIRGSEDLQLDALPNREIACFVVNEKLLVLAWGVNWQRKERKKSSMQTAITHSTLSLIFQWPGVQDGFWGYCITLRHDINQHFDNSFEPASYKCWLNIAMTSLRRYWFRFFSFFFVDVMLITFLRKFQRNALALMKERKKSNFIHSQ